MALWLTELRLLISLRFRSSVKLGDLNLNDAVSDGATPVTMEVSETIVHPKYYDNPIINDIALIRMKNKVTFNSKYRDGKSIS